MIRLMGYPSFNQGAVVRPDRACSFGLTLTLPRCEDVHPDEGNNYEHESQCNELFHPGYFPFAFTLGVLAVNRRFAEQLSVVLKF
jgi:hypothetical protein